MIMILQHILFDTTFCIRPQKTPPLFEGGYEKANLFLTTF